MSNQKKLSKLNILDGERQRIAYVLDLEKKYFNFLWETFTSDSFINDLLFIEDYIKENYISLKNTWSLKNKLKIPAERLARHHIYKKFSTKLTNIYPSPISSDIAFITDDAVINIDVKTIDTRGNRNDTSYLQFETNQSSFKNCNLHEISDIPNSGIKAECLLPHSYNHNNRSKPILTFFLVLVYEDDDNTSFKLSRENNYETIQLKCLPNGILSSLFENDIISNFKTYKYFQEKDNFAPIFLTEDNNAVDTKLKEFVKNNPEYKLMNTKNKSYAFIETIQHPRYGTNGISYFPVQRKKDGKYYLEAVKCGDTMRTSNSTLENRFDSNDSPWLGVKKLIL